jgi:HD superfamily phosphodiesterase
MPDYLGIDDNRLKHMRAVGNRAYDLARDLFEWPENKCREMLVLGFLHDIGYMFSEHQSQHAWVGADLLTQLGYKHAYEVRFHGAPKPPHQTQAMLILNLADMTVDHTGQPVAMSQRVAQIETRYGEDSPQYRDALELVTALRKQTQLWGINLPVDTIGGL